MFELTEAQIHEVSGGKFRFKWHINIFQTLFSAVGAFILTGPIGAGVIIGSAIAAQGAGQLNDMYQAEFNR